MPNQPKTPIRPVRVEDALWFAAKKQAAERGETVSDVIRRALRDYLVKRSASASSRHDRHGGVPAPGAQ